MNRIYLLTAPIIVSLMGSVTYAETRAYTTTGGVAPSANVGTVPVPPGPAGTPTAAMQLSTGDAHISANIETKLINDPRLKGTNIKAISTGGVVTLDGTVNSQEQADAAVSVARTESGVKEVTSKLTINNTSANPAIQQPSTGAAPPSAP